MSTVISTGADFIKAVERPAGPVPLGRRSLPSCRSPRNAGPPWRTAAILLGTGLFAASPLAARSQALPDSPGALLSQPSPVPPAPSPSPAAQQGAGPNKLPYCQPPLGSTSPLADASSLGSAATNSPCRIENPVQSVVSSTRVQPLNARRKARLAVHDVTDPFNLISIAGYSAIGVASNAHSAFGPGLQGWGRLTGYSLLGDAQGEFFGTFLIPSLTHEDPRYHRLPRAPLKHRVLHAVGHTWVSQHDDGHPMPNYATLLNYPIGAELANLYVPGVRTNARSTGRRIGLGLATDPSGTLIAEFLPDIARHIHVHTILIQEIINHVVTGGTAPTPSGP